MGRRQPRLHVQVCAGARGAIEADQWLCRTGAAAGPASVRLEGAVLRRLPGQLPARADGRPLHRRRQTVSPQPRQPPTVVHLRPSTAGISCARFKLFFFGGGGTD